MTIEIELKFIATPQAAEKLGETLAAWPHQHFAARELTNIYFETDDNQLRRWDMGLRIRGVDQRYEMTLKAAGKTVGGLHQRPEYNVDQMAPMSQHYSSVCNRYSAPISSVKPGWCSLAKAKLKWRLIAERLPQVN